MYATMYLVYSTFRQMLPRKFYISSECSSSGLMFEWDSTTFNFYLQVMGFELFLMNNELCNINKLDQKKNLI